MAALVGHLLALEAIKLLTGYAHSWLTGRLLVQDLIRQETTFYTAVRFPQCQVCGRGNKNTPVLTD
jgi:molybdopterin/thiamine biosynthesis adenylyltransferase